MLDLVVNRVPQAIRDAILGKGGRLVVLHEVDHPDGFVRACSLAAPLRFEGEVWAGFGDLVSIEGIGGSRRTEVRVVTVTLSGVKPKQLQFITKKVRGRFARITLAALKPRSRAVDGEVFRLCTGKCDTQDQKIGTDRSTSIVITINQPLFVLDRAPNLAWTPDWLKATYGSDIVGLDDQPGVASREESWTQS